jgi:Ca2+/Na+ antiporter
MNNLLENLKSFRSLFELYMQKDLQFKEKFKISPEAYHIHSIKKMLNETQQILNRIYIIFGVIILPLFLFFINKSWFSWFQISYFLLYIVIVLIFAFVIFWIQKIRKQNKEILINQIDASYKTLKLFFDQHPEILEYYQRGQLEFEDAELVELYQEKVAKREKMLDQINKVLKNKN